MPLIDHYAALRHSHLTAVALSLGLFAARGVGVQLGQAWPMWPAVRRVSVAIDIVLLGAGAGLWATLRLEAFGRDAWLGTKLGLLVVYIVLGSLALKRAPTAGVRRACLLLAAACAAAMVGVAIAHHPAGWFKS